MFYSFGRKIIKIFVCMEMMFGVHMMMIYYDKSLKYLPPPAPQIFSLWLFLLLSVWQPDNSPAASTTPYRTYLRKILSPAPKYMNHKNCLKNINITISLFNCVGFKGLFRIVTEFFLKSLHMWNVVWCGVWCWSHNSLI